MTLVMTPLPLAHAFACFSMFVYIRAHSASHRLEEIWQLSRQGATGKLEAEFKFQRFSCKLSFLFPRHHPGELARRLIIFFIIVTITFIKSLLQTYHGLNLRSGMGIHVKKTVTRRKDLRPHTSERAPIKGALRKDKRPWKKVTTTY